MPETIPTARLAGAEALAEACRLGRAAILSPRTPAGRGRLRRGGLLALQSDHVPIALPPEAPDDWALGAVVHVTFVLHGRRYRFAGGVLSVTGDAIGVSGETLLRLQRPTVVCHAQRRLPFSVEVGPERHVDLRLSAVRDAEREFNLRLARASDRGLVGWAERNELSRAATGDLYWARLEGPGGRVLAQFVVRLAHRPPEGRRPQAVCGWRFAPVDEPSLLEAGLRALARTLAPAPREARGASAGRSEHAQCV